MSMHIYANWAMHRTPPKPWDWLTEHFGFDQPRVGTTELERSPGLPFIAEHTTLQRPSEPP